MSSSFLSSHPDFTSPPPLGPLTLHPCLNGSFSNNPIELLHFRTIQRIIKEHPEFTETYQLLVPSSEPGSALIYSLRTTPTHPPSKMSGKQTMTWNGESIFLPPTASKEVHMASATDLLNTWPSPQWIHLNLTHLSIASFYGTNFLNFTGDAHAKLLLAILKVSDVKLDFEAVAEQASPPFRLHHQ